MKKKFNLDGPDGFNAYWRDLRKEARYSSKINFGGGTVMIWLAFCANGTLNLAFPSTKMKSSEYIKLLRPNLLLYLHDNDEEWLFLNAVYQPIFQILTVLLLPLCSVIRKNFLPKFNPKLKNGVSWRINAA